jgi:hypothetical protein
MKIKGIRVLLALLLSSMMILGIAGIAEAGRPNRVFTVELTQIAGTGAHEGETLLRASIEWDGYRSYGYHVEWYQFESGGFALKDEPTHNTLPFGKTGSPVITYYGPDCAVSGGEVWQIQVTLLRKNGSVSKHPKMIWHTIVVDASYDLPFTEDFTGLTGGLLPDGWSTNNSSVVYVAISSHANGTSPELCVDWNSGENTVWDYWACTPTIDTAAAATTLNLTFKHHLFVYNWTRNFTYSVEVSNDAGSTWTAVLEETPTEAQYPGPDPEIGPETLDIDLSAYVGDDILIRWRLRGYTYWSDGWYIDDVCVDGS